MLYPKPIRKGDCVAILSPATEVRKEFVDGAESFLRRRGYEVAVMPSALGPAEGSFASSLKNRLNDIESALRDDSVKAILCARGGYGCVHLLQHMPLQFIREHAKWIVGFSDVSALHALWQSAGVASVHGPMAKHLATEGDDDPCSELLMQILEGRPEYEVAAASSPYNRRGKGKGVLRGGNLAVLNGLASTPYDLMDLKDGEDVVLFIEDISEAIYAVERMLFRLFLSGAFGRVKGLIVGQFTEYRPDRNHGSMEEMIDSFLSRCGIEGLPVAFGFSVGHVSDNRPLIEGARVELSVSEDSSVLKVMTI